MKTRMTKIISLLSGLMLCFGMVCTADAAALAVKTRNIGSATIVKGNTTGVSQTRTSAEVGDSVYFSEAAKVLAVGAHNIKVTTNMAGLTYKPSSFSIVCTSAFGTPTANLATGDGSDAFTGGGMAITVPSPAPAPIFIFCEQSWQMTVSSAYNNEIEATLNIDAGTDTGSVYVENPQAEMTKGAGKIDMHYGGYYDISGSPSPVEMPANYAIYSTNDMSDVATNPSAVACVGGGSSNACELTVAGMTAVKGAKLKVSGLTGIDGTKLKDNTTGDYYVIDGLAPQISGNAVLDTTANTLTVNFDEATTQPSMAAASFTPSAGSFGTGGGSGAWSDADTLVITLGAGYYVPAATTFNITGVAIKDSLNNSQNSYTGIGITGTYEKPVINTFTSPQAGGTTAVDNITISNLAATANAKNIEKYALMGNATGTGAPDPATASWSNFTTPGLSVTETFSLSLTSILGGAPVSGNTYDVYAFVKDVNGIVSVASGAMTVTYNNTAPTGAVSSVPNKGKTGTVIAMTVTFSEPVDAAKITLSGANVVAETAMTGNDGDTVWTYNHTMTAGNGTVNIALSGKKAGTAVDIVSVPTTGETVWVDNTAPTLADASPASGTTFSGTQVVTFSATEAAIDGVTPAINVRYTTDGTVPTMSSASACSGNGTCSGSITLAATTIVKYTACDEVGNCSAVKTATYTYSGGGGTTGGGSSGGGGGGGGGGGSTTTVVEAYQVSDTPSSTRTNLNNQAFQLPQEGDTAGVFTRPIRQMASYPDGTASVEYPKETKATKKNGQPYTGEFLVPARWSVFKIVANAKALPVITSSVLGSTSEEIFFDKKVKVTLPLPTDNTFDKAKLRAYYYNAEKNQYELLGGSVPDGQEYIEFEVEHFSNYVVFESSDAVIAGTGETVVTDPNAGSDGFTDIIGHWAESFINALAERGVVSGKTATTFDPNANITRAELTKISLLNFGKSVDADATNNFSDVSSADWYYGYVSTAEEDGIVGGYSDGTFKPNNSINRAEAIKILVGASGVDVSAYALGDDVFYDVSSTDWYAPYLAYLYAEGIISGYETEIGGGVSGDFSALAPVAPGASGDSVVALQTALQSLGYYTGAIDGNYGASTTRAVAEYQVAAELVDSVSSFGAGWFGNSTYTSLKKTLDENSGDGEVRTVLLFKPSANITRAEVAKIATLLAE